MDGIGLAASIIQIIDVSSRVVGKGFDIYQSADGQLTEHAETDHVTRALSNSAQRIRKSIAASHQPRTDAEKEQLMLAADCQQIAQELLSALERLKRRGQPGKCSSLRQGLKAVWNEDKIASLERRLDRYRQQMIQSILETLRVQTQASAAQQSTILRGIKNIQRRQDKLQDAQVSIGHQFFQEIRSCVGNTDGERWRQDLLGAIHQKPDLRPRNPTQSPKRRKTRRSLIKSLKFQEMEDREIRIPKAHRETFKWIYEPPTVNTRPWSSFRSFLRRKKGGIYWITGKPGSGKSTLMKYLMRNDQTFDLLRRWAPDGVITSAFYSWNSGTDIQMSVEGLLRTLLAKCLEQLPRRVVEEVLPWRWEALSLLVCRDRRSFFLIDGLDEFSGDHGMLTDLILTLESSAPNVKSCVASRPWVNFEDAFRSKPHLMLQDLTKGDIEQYISSTFRESPGFLELEQREPQHTKSLLSEVARKAEGVFLWVRLVVKSLLVGMANGDGIRELRERLDRIPSNLEAMFKKMLASMEPSYLQHASQIFQIHRASRDPPSLLVMAFADLEDQNEVLQKLLWPLSHSNIVARCRHMKRKLSSRCKGLLEIESPPALGQQSDTDDGTENNCNHADPITDCRVQYLHRTVKDFIESPDIWGWIVATNKEPFDPCVALAKSYLLRLKSMDTMKPTYDEIWDRALWCISYAKQAELNKGPIQTELMDELDRTATALTRHLQSIDATQEDTSAGTLSSSLDEETHWTSYGLAAVGTSFVYLMAMCGMFGFLEAKLAYNDPALRHYDDSKTPLLFAALEDYLVLSQYSAGKNIIVDSPSKKTIRVLLQKGADPYQLHRGRSAHTIARTMASRGDRDFIEVLKIVKECAQHASKRWKRPQIQSLPQEPVTLASPAAQLTAENLKQLDPSHGEIPTDYLRAQNGSVLDRSLTTLTSDYYPEGPSWLQRLLSKIAS
ncbi:small s [Fusarium albosuccineum]|uniref:Small s n=1 Tax=Fusarium albosuccineum TaxID=1237068 RepID=A0A8H4LAP9_9HYPO|nr:small s [Fusarium albosuccineum]